MGSEQRSTSRWLSVSSMLPCPICGKADWCGRTFDGTVSLCRRVAGSSGPRRDRSGAIYYIHIRAPKCHPLDSIQVRSAAPAQVQRASEEVLDSVYSFLLSNVLELSPMHRQGLNERGLKDDQINKREYRSMPITTAIVRRWIGDVVQTNFPRSTLLGVPGFYADKFSEVCLGAMPGLLIPVRTDLGRIIALKLRRDTTQHGQPKYLSVSSSRNGGPGPGAPVHVPLFGDTVSEIVWATEGELKADVATALRGGLTISFPGVNSWPTIIPVLKRLNAKEVVLAFDADARTNPTVAAALSGAFKGLKALGFCVKIATWNGDSNGE